MVTITINVDALPQDINKYLGKGTIISYSVYRFIVIGKFQVGLF